MIAAVIRFTSKRLGISDKDIHSHTTIESDLGMAGLDTLEFFSEFFEVFGVENPEDFNADKYVTPENLDPVRAIRSLISKRFRERHLIQEVTIQHLARVAEQKCWIDVV